jgi:hypothetical protein
LNTAGLGLRLLASNNLSDVPNKPTALTTLGAAAVAHGHTQLRRLVTTLRRTFGGVKTFLNGIEGRSVGTD